MPKTTGFHKLVTVPEWHVIQSIRYALPRQTYAASDTIASTRELWPQLTQLAKNVILKDIEDALKTSTLLNSIDAPEWQTLFDELNAQQPPTP